MDWVLVGKSYLILLIGHISIHLIQGMLRLRRRCGLSFGIEDWVDGKTGLYIIFHILSLRFVGTLKFSVLDSLVCGLSICFGNKIFLPDNPYIY